MRQVNGVWTGGLLLAALCAGCGGEGRGDGNDVTASAGTPPPANAAMSSAPAVQERAEGGASFAVDGSAMQFDALPDGHNYYTSMASQIVLEKG